MTRIRLAAFALGAITLGALSPIQAKEGKAPNEVSPILKALDKTRPILAVVRKHYPNATSTMLGKKFHFEDSTRLYVEPMIAKFPAGQKAPLAEVRGPSENGGVWCNIDLLEGSSKPYARAEGALERENFVEHIIYQDLSGIDHHLHVTLRVPKGEGSAAFVKEFTSLIRSYIHDFATDR